MTFKKEFGLPLEIDPERAQPRIKDTLTAYIHGQDQEIKCVARDFSEYGLFLQTDEIQPVGNEISLDVEIPGQTVLLKGKVSSTRRSRASGSANPNTGMGILLDPPPEEYTAYVDQARWGKEETASRRQAQRFQLHHRVRFETREQFLTEYTSNLSRGGMYIETDELFRPGSLLQLRLDIPGVKEPLNFQGRVAYQLDREKAVERNVAAGVGVQFVEIDPEAQQIIRKHLQQVECFRHNLYHGDGEELPDEGALVVNLVPDLLLKIARSGATSTLKLKGRYATKTIYFSYGRPIHVESSIKSESLGNFLVDQGILTPSDLEISLADKAKDDREHAELLLRGGMLDGATVAKSFVECHEARIRSTFGWFDGEFEFKLIPKIPNHIFAMPMRTFQIIFSGVRDWYDPSIIQAWLGLSEDNVLCRTSLPPASTSLPPGVLRFLDRLSEPKTVAQLSEELKVPVEVLLPISFAVILAGWVVLQPSSVIDERKKGEIEKPSSEDQASKKPLSHKDERILSEHQELQLQDFYKLLGVSRGIHETVLTRLFMDRMKRYAEFQKDTDLSSEAREKLKDIMSWFRVAYDTLRDPNLRKVYARLGKPRGNEENQAALAQADRLLMGALLDLQRNEGPGAEKKLEEAVEKFPENVRLRGYLGWARFLNDPPGGYADAINLLSHAIEKDSADPEMRFFLGKVYAYLDDWKRAEHAFSVAVRLDSTMNKARAALERIREKMRGKKRL